MCLPQEGDECSLAGGAQLGHGGGAAGDRQKIRTKIIFFKNQIRKVLQRRMLHTYEGAFFDGAEISFLGSLLVGLPAGAVDLFQEGILYADDQLVGEEILTLVAA